ncbi:MAG: nickel pincer cofactor biosynthesis protein LarC [Planctomycetes bacterium]|nr:nickel pincer cofactor biosynthesis protein LarC [Planctomycetota bacterium]
MTAALFEPFGGIAGDMTVSAFLDLGMEIEVLRAGLSALPLPGYAVSAEKVWRGAIRATHFSVAIDEHHPHRGLRDVREIIERGRLPARVTARALEVFKRLAEAEGKVHGVPPEEVHFHEVGAVDAIVDVVGTALALEHFGVERVLCTRIRTGTGEVECAHGRIPAPGPATLSLLTGFPLEIAEGEGETVTPTGAAILAGLSKPLGHGATFTPRACGFGAGTRDDTARPNVLRITLGEAGPGAAVDEVEEIEANLDDLSPEVTAHAAAQLLSAGALDAWLTPIAMKKGRPGTLLSVLARPVDADRLAEMVLRETSTFGVRRSRKSRTVLDRRHERVETPFGPVRVKIGLRRGEVLTRAPEYEDCARLAAEKGVPVREVYLAALRA